MKMNGKATTTRRTNTIDFAPAQETAKLPVVKATQATDKIEAKLALIERRQAIQEKQRELEMQQMMGAAAVLNNVAPVVIGVMGDPNLNFERMCDVMVARDVDVFSDELEITFESD